MLYSSRPKVSCVFKCSITTLKSPESNLLPAEASHTVTGGPEGVERRKGRLWSQWFGFYAPDAPGSGDPSGLGSREFHAGSRHPSSRPPEQRGGDDQLASCTDACGKVSGGSCRANRGTCFYAEARFMDRCAARWRKTLNVLLKCVEVSSHCVNLPKN